MNIQRSQSTHRFNNGGSNCLDNNRDQDTNHTGDEVVDDASVEYGAANGSLSSVPFDTNLAIDSNDRKSKFIVFVVVVFY